jgi:hypothetical protein
MQRRYSICYFCGRKAEISSESPPCVMLEGWLSVTHWKGMESVDQYDFCCFTCLEKWAHDQSTQVPKVFLESFNEEPGGENTTY